MPDPSAMRPPNDPMHTSQRALRASLTRKSRSAPVGHANRATRRLHPGYEVPSTSTARSPDGAIGDALACPMAYSGTARSNKSRAIDPDSVSSPALEDDLAARGAGFQQRMRALEIGGVDGAEVLTERPTQHALAAQISN